MSWLARRRDERLEHVLVRLVAAEVERARPGMVYQLERATDRRWAVGCGVVKLPLNGSHLAEVTVEHRLPFAPRAVSLTLAHKAGDDQQIQAWLEAFDYGAESFKVRAMLLQASGGELLATWVAVVDMWNQRVLGEETLL
jgi:hypothetical protein